MTRNPAGNPAGFCFLFLKAGLEIKTPAFSIAFHEWRDMLKDVLQPGLTIKQRWMYLFGPPGWSHDGSRKTSEMMRKEWREKSEAGL
jgi:hypothetical protein